MIKTNTNIAIEDESEYKEDNKGLYQNHLPNQKDRAKRNFYNEGNNYKNTDESQNEEFTVSFSSFEDTHDQQRKLRYYLFTNLFTYLSLDLKTREIL